MDEKSEKYILGPKFDAANKTERAFKVLCALIKNPTICPQSHTGYADSLLEDAFKIADKFEVAAKERYPA